MLDLLVVVMGREAVRLEERSRTQELVGPDMDKLIALGTSVSRIADQLNNPFSPTYQARLRRLTEGQLEAHKARMLAIEAQVADSEEKE